MHRCDNGKLNVNKCKNKRKRTEAKMLQLIRIKRKV